MPASGAAQRNAELAAAWEKRGETAEPATIECAGLSVVRCLTIGLDLRFFPLPTRPLPLSSVQACRVDGSVCMHGLHREHETTGEWAKNGDKGRPVRRLTSVSRCIALILAPFVVSHPCVCVCVLRACAGYGHQASAELTHVRKQRRQGRRPVGRAWGAAVGAAGAAVHALICTFVLSVPWLVSCAHIAGSLS